MGLPQGHTGRQRSSKTGRLSGGVCGLSASRLAKQKKEQAKRHTDQLETGQVLTAAMPIDISTAGVS